MRKLAAGSTYTPLATTTLGSAQSSYTFSSISSTYTDLVLVTNYGASIAGMTPFIRFNSDTGTNYSDTILYGTGSKAGSARDTSATRIFIGQYQVGSSATDGNNMTITHIQNYANSTTYKTVLSRSGAAEKETNAIVGLWRSTSAINSISVVTTSGNFNTGSTFTLYGIAAA